MYTSKSFLPILGIVILFSLAACEGSNRQAETNANSWYNSAPVEKAMDVAEEASETGADEVIAIERKLIKNGDLEFETDDLQESRKVLLAAVAKHSAYISSDQAFKSTGRKSNTVIVRVPSTKFDAFLADATEGVEKFERKEINVQDVTEEFLDIEARVKTKKELESRYLALLSKANSISDILEIERQIGQLRAEIESIEGRLKYLQNQVSYSTLSLSFFERVPGDTAFGRKFKEGFRNGWDNLIWFFVALTNIWPFILLIALLLVALGRYRKRKINR